MKLIIDISEGIKVVIDKNGTNETVAETLWQAAKKGIPLEQMLEQITAEIYEEFMTIDGNVHDKSAIKCMEIIGKYKAERSGKE